MYIQLLIIAVIPAMVSAMIFLLENKGILSRVNYRVKQLVIGIIFGAIACAGTSFGVDVGGALANTRDAAIVSCGLLFGVPSGILAGLIGGIYRWFSVYWGAGEFTRIACSSACILAGFYAGFVRHFMFDRKLPSWVLSIFVGFVMEVVHLNLLFLTNINDLETTLDVLNALSIPMLVCNSIGTALPVLVITAMSGEKLFYSRSQAKLKISQIVQNYLLVTVLIALIASALFTTMLQVSLAFLDTSTALKSAIEDVKKDIEDASDDNLLKITQRIASYLDSTDQALLYDSLYKVALRFDVDEINIVDSNGIIVASTNDSFVGYDMSLGEQSAEFMPLLRGVNEMVQRYMPISLNSEVYMKYAAVTLKKGGFVQVGYGSEKFYDDLESVVEVAAVNRSIDSEGYIVITDDAFFFKSYGRRSGIANMRIDSGRMVFGSILDTAPEYKMFRTNVLDNDVYCMYTTTEGYKIIGIYPKSEAMFDGNIAIYAYTFSAIIIFAILFAVIYILLRVKVVNNIYEINKSLAQITNGNLDTVVTVGGNEEFDHLSNDINSTVDTLKRYIDEAASRIDAELQYAKDIQYSALPNISPRFDNRPEFDLYATMCTAKEVGGDFYDFYYVDDSHLAITIADVSGKGIPAALFMMTSKTMIRNMIASGMNIGEALTLANERLCEGNEANMFVTVWAAVVDLNTGHVSFANAGHNPPAVRKKDGTFELIKNKVGLVLAGMDGMMYKEQELTLEPGDVMFLYTDGVTEATDAHDELYGDDRLVNALNTTYEDGISMNDICVRIKEDVDTFVGEAPQFDDMTMLAIRFKGNV